MHCLTVVAQTNTDFAALKVDFFDCGMMTTMPPLFEQQKHDLKSFFFVVAVFASSSFQINPRLQVVYSQGPKSVCYQLDDVWEDCGITNTLRICQRLSLVVPNYGGDCCS